jgi:hypothetical protein
MAQSVLAFNDLQLQLVTGLNTVIQSFSPLQSSAETCRNLLFRLDLAPMRFHNAAAPASGSVCYPPGIVAAPPLPITISDAIALNGP